MSIFIYTLIFVAGILAALIFLRIKSARGPIASNPDRLQQEIHSQEEINSPAVEEKSSKLDLIQKQLNNLFLVNELSQRITSSLSIEESFSYLYQTINSMMDASVAELVVHGDQNDRLFFSNEKYPDKNIKLDSYNHFSEWCFDNKKEVFLEDVENDFGRYVFKSLTLPDGKSAKSLMCFPVYSQEKIAGTLCIISFTKNAFELFHIEMIRLLLPFIGVAINNSNSHQQIIDLKQRAERSEQFMQVFLANMSHEIRTPMNAVMGMTNLLLQKNPQREQLKYLNTIQKSSENLLVILNDILDLSKIEAGKIEIEKIDFSLRDILNNVKEIIQFKAEEKGLALVVNADEKIPAVLTGDPTRLTQILINLLGNSVKFTEKGSVKLNVKLSGTEREIMSSTNENCRLHFSVEDSGIGMTEEQQKKLFQNYTQASTETARKYGGTGLGLSISKQLVQLQGGSIEIKSEPGRGSTFSFSLAYPVSKNKEMAPKEKIISQSMLDKLSGIRVLLADDNEYNRIVVKETLELKIKNVKIDEAIDGLIALKMLRENDYDVIMMDLVMPNLNGLETTQKIRTGFPEGKKQIPVIAITASVLKSEIDKCFASGMNGFIPKPFKTGEMLSALYNVLIENIPAQIPSQSFEPNKSNTIIDHEFVKELSEGDEERIKRYADLFVEKAPQTISELKSAMQNNDLEKIRIGAHSMKSVLRFNGIVSGYELAENIEQNCINGTDLDHLPELITRLETICKMAIKELIC